MIHQLLTTFKLKEYIISKLKTSRYHSNISLSEYYETSNKKILLNFTTIDVNRQRFSFLNKNTMPNMPLWAAIVATSTLPFYHDFFEGSQEWETTNAKSFQYFFIYEFFKTNKLRDKNKIQFTSGNFVSSLPLELLTNSTIKKGLLDS